MMKRGLVFLILLPMALAAECDNWQQEHPEYLLCEDFEDYNGNFMDWYDSTEWYSGESDDRGRIDLSTESFSGDYSLYMPAASSSGYMGASLRWYDCVGDHVRPCEQNGNEELYFRAYFKLAPDHEYVHHFMSLGASQPEIEEFWNSMGLAGCRPNGAISAGTTVDFNDQMESHFYTYSIDMTCNQNYDCCAECASKGLPCEGSTYCCWGDHYPENPAPNSMLPKDEWVCMELRMKLNTPNIKDGVMAYWIDDELIHQENNMFWRIDPELQMNSISLQHYIDSGEADQSNRIWWDNVVVSTQPIGCFGSQPTPPEQCTSADTNIDGIIQNIELLGFINNWKMGSVNTEQLMDVIGKWKNGC